MNENTSENTNVQAVYERKILKNKVFLYLTEFFAGMSVMAVELGASRLLAPYFSSSQIVWTIIIGTIMIAMALGNIYGGRKADKDPNPDKLYGRILIAAIWIALIPVLGKYVIIGISALFVFTINQGFLIVAGLVCCMVIFVFPLFLLGTVTPSLVKYIMSDLSDNGRIVGRLNAANTIGSIIGTFVPTFISIPTVGTSVTFLIFGGILLLLSVIYFLTSGLPFKKIKKVPVGIAIFILCCIFGHDTSFAFWENDLAFEGESIYNYLQVREDDREVILSTNVLFGVQSVYRKEKSLTGMYYDYAMAAPYMCGVHEKDAPMDVLILGMGTGTYATQLNRYFGEMNVIGVEIDEDITSLARDYFELPESVPVVTYDGRAYLHAADAKYDVIMVDAYQDITIPFQMASTEFFEEVRTHLKDGGVMIVNMNMRGEGEGTINQYLADTISHSFSEVYTIDVPYTTNRELFASNNPEMIGRLEKNLALEEDEELVTMIGRVDENLTRYAAGDYFMTDDKAPVELLSMKAIDAIIKDEVDYYKEIYKNRRPEGPH